MYVNKMDLKNRTHTCHAQQWPTPPKYRPYELSDKSLYEWVQIYERLKRTKEEQKRFQSQKNEDVKPPAVLHSDKEIDTDFDSDSDHLESDQTQKKEGIPRKYPFLQNHPLYETHQVSISKPKNLIPNFAGGSLLDVTEEIENTTVLQC